jgi:HAD superfamily hydrolase (TIGR01509 family)
MTPDAAAIFDMDGVLVESGGFHRAAWRALLRELGAEPPGGDFWRLTIGRPVEEALPILLGRRLSAHEIRRYSRRRTDLYHQLADGRLEPVAGAVDFVRALTRRNVPRALATSASGWSVAVVLGGLGLASHFPVVVTADDVERGKPDPEVYLTAASRLGVPPRACVVFEDSLVGVEAARRAGMRPIGLTTAHTEAELRRAGAVLILGDFEGASWDAIAAA